MEIIESIAWVTLGFLPMLGSMELAWRLSDKKRFKKMKTEKKVPVHVTLQK
jgi:hypothetical protein